LITLFNIYDVDGSGTLDYNEFTNVVFGRPQTAQSRPATASVNQSPEQLAESLKEKLAKRGAKGIIGLQRQFKIMDDDNSKSLSRAEFAKAIQDFGLGFSKEQCVALFNYFDVDSSGQISYDEFLRAIRGPMNQARKKIVSQAFNKLDKDANGWIDISDLKGVYNAKKHPEVIQGKKTEDDILKEFLATFEMHHSMRNNNAPNYVVTKEEFEEYYNNVSMSIDDDMYFMQMMNASWRMDEKEKAQFEATKKRAAMDNDIFGTTERRTTAKPKEAGLIVDANQAQILDHIRARIAARGARGI
jgi:Ca2+-binding EF-hand superfamily protein